MATATFKVQPFLLHNDLDLASCPPITETIHRRAYCPPPPLNLRVFGDGHVPTYTTGQDIVVDWDAVSDLPERLAHNGHRPADQRDARPR